MRSWAAATSADSPGPSADPFADPFAAFEPGVRTASAAEPAAAPESVVPAAANDPFAPAEPAAGAEPAADVPETAEPAGAGEQLVAAVDAAIAAGEILEAHTALSRLWWDAPADRPAIRGRLDGTARQIYFDADSHFMTPRTVAPGETLADVAADLALPEMYLARVNRVAPQSVTPGDELKVIRGPFGAACDLAGGTFTVHAHGYYVRAFRCDAAGVEPGGYTVAAKAKSDAGLRILLTPADGGAPVTLSAGGEPTAAAPGLALSVGDAAQAFDLLDVGGAVSVRP